MSLSTMLGAFLGFLAAMTVYRGTLTMIDALIARRNQRVHEAPSAAYVHDLMEDWRKNLGQHPRFDAPFGNPVVRIPTDATVFMSSEDLSGAPIVGVINDGFGNPYPADVFLYTHTDNGLSHTPPRGMSPVEAWQHVIPTGVETQESGDLFTTALRPMTDPGQHARPGDEQPNAFEDAYIEDQQPQPPLLCTGLVDCPAAVHFPGTSILPACEALRQQVMTTDGDWHELTMTNARLWWARTPQIGEYGTPDQPAAFASLKATQPAMPTLGPECDGTLTCPGHLHTLSCSMNKAVDHLAEIEKAVLRPPVVTLAEWEAANLRLAPADQSWLEVEHQSADAVERSRRAME